MADSDEISGGDSRPTRVTSFVRGCGCLAMLLVAAAILLPALARTNSRPRSSCANNLRQVGLSLKMYSNEDPRERYPDLSLEPGRLMFAPSPIYPEYLPDPTIELCPQDSDHKKFARNPGEQALGGNLKDGIDFPSLIDDWSYYYLGYAITNDDEMQRFAKAYRDHASAGKAMTEDLTFTDDPAGQRMLYRLTEGVENKLLAQLDIAPEEPGATGRAQSKVPILIERIGNHDATQGANILYLDGHVKFIKYPGPWPMTEKTVRILNELDALDGSPSSP